MIPKRIALVMLGDAHTGRSSIRRRWMGQEWIEEGETHLGVARETHTMTLPNGVTIKVLIFDTNGRDYNRHSAPMYYREASVAIIVYDITNQVSFVVVHILICHEHTSITVIGLIVLTSGIV